MVRRECLQPRGLSVTDGARALGVTRQALNNLLNQKSGVSPEMAIRLEKAFGGAAVTWLERAQETPEISDEEYHGLWYELGLAHEADGNEEAAARFFEKIYTENVDFRDVSQRVRDLVAH